MRNNLFIDNKSFSFVYIKRQSSSWKMSHWVCGWYLSRVLLIIRHGDGGRSAGGSKMPIHSGYLLNKTLADPARASACCVAGLTTLLSLSKFPWVTVSSLIQWFIFPISNIMSIKRKIFHGDGNWPLTTGAAVINCLPGIGIWTSLLLCRFLCLFMLHRKVRTNNVKQLHLHNMNTSNTQLVTWHFNAIVLKEFQRERNSYLVGSHCCWPNMHIMLRWCRLVKSSAHDDRLGCR